MAPPSDDEYCPNFVFEPPSDEEYSDTGEHKDSGPLQQQKLAVAISNSGSEFTRTGQKSNFFMFFIKEGTMDMASLESQKRYGNEVISAEQAEYLQMKEKKKKRELEKNMPRKKRRKLEAARELLEDENRAKWKIRSTSADRGAQREFL